MLVELLNLSVSIENYVKNLILLTFLKIEMSI